MPPYKFEIGQRVRLASDLGTDGEVVHRVPGNGQFAWYYVKFEDGTEDRFMGIELKAA